MKEVIQQVVAAEAEAKQRVQAAKISAGQMVDSARRRSQEILAAAREQARQEATRIIEEGALADEAEKQRRLVEAETELAATVRLEAATAQQIIAAVADLVRGVNGGNPDAKL